MRLLGYELSLRRSGVQNRVTDQAAQIKAAIAAWGIRDWFGVIQESFSGAFQANVEVDAPRDILAYSGVFSPLTLITSDIGKLRPRLVEEDENGICAEVFGSPLSPVLRRPNRFQNRIQFIEQWVLSKLLYGNTYVLKERDLRGVVIALHILDAQRVTPLVAFNGDVYYRCSGDHLCGLSDKVTLPASEIIHDRWNCLWHPLVGVSPLYAAGISATMGRRIQNNSAAFFQNMSRPSGMLTTPDTIPDDVAIRLKRDWETNFSQNNIGRVAVLGNNLKYESMNVPAEQAQLIQQLEWTVRDIAACFHMPMFKVGGPVPANHTIEALNLQYYTDCLQTLIESMELCLDEGLGLATNRYVEFDLDGLMRMDTAAQIDSLNKAVAGGWMKPNEARRRRNMAPVVGGDTPYLQQQNYALAALAKRDAKEDPFGSATKPSQAAAPAAPAPPAAPAAPPAPAGEGADADTEDAAAEKLAAALVQKFLEPILLEEITQ